MALKNNQFSFYFKVGTIKINFYHVVLCSCILISFIYLVLRMKK